jgi:hypothetical protein
MIRPFILATMLLVSLASADCIADTGKEVTATILPDQIWAFDMPGTRDIEKSVPQADFRRLEEVFKLSYIRAYRREFKNISRPGFAVAGSGVSALRAALAIFEKGVKPSSKFSSEDEVTLVFFSEPPRGNQVRILKIKQHDRHFEIQYRLDPDFVRNSIQTFALIPIGNLRIGEYRVEMRQLPREEKYVKLGYGSLDEEWSRNFLCKPFSFTVTANGK